MKGINIIFKKHSETAKLPIKMTLGASCMDFYADESISLTFNKVIRVKTNISVKMPVDCELQIRPRSGLSLKNVLVILGTVDSDYTEPIDILMLNLNVDSFKIEKGDRIAQLKINFSPNINFLDENGDVLICSNNSREGGFGSTGKSL